MSSLPRCSAINMGIVALIRVIRKEGVNNLGNYTVAVLYCDKTRYRSKEYFLALTDKDAVLDEGADHTIIETGIVV
jgi:hypothetical protein